MLQEEPVSSKDNVDSNRDQTGHRNKVRIPQQSLNAAEKILDSNIKIDDISSSFAAFEDGHTFKVKVSDKSLKAAKRVLEDQPGLDTDPNPERLCSPPNTDSAYVHQAFFHREALYVSKNNEWLFERI